MAYVSQSLFKLAPKHLLQATFKWPPLFYYVYLDSCSSIHCIQFNEKSASILCMESFWSSLGSIFVIVCVGFTHL